MSRDAALADLRLTRAQREALCDWIASTANAVINGGKRPMRGTHAVKVFAEGMIEALNAGSQDQHPGSSSER
jgi:hypothetical protein